MCRWNAAARALIFLFGLGALSSAVGADADSPAPQRPSNFWDVDIWADPERGFLFYQPDAPKRRAAPSARQKPRPGTRPLSEIRDHDELRAEREARLKIAIMQPSPENMKLYLEANTYMLQKSAMFSDMWRRTVWQNPEFDWNVQNPNANFAQTSIRLDREASKRRVVADLSRDYGIFYFTRSDCPYCKLQGPVLREMQRQFGIEVMAITMDGSPVEGFPDARADNGISMRVSSGQGVSAVPALFLVSRHSSEAVMLGAGVLSITDIVERINVLTQTRPGEDISGGIR